MLIFFLVAGRITPPADRDVQLPGTGTSSVAALPEALFMRRDGSLNWRSANVTPELFIQSLQENDALKNDVLKDAWSGSTIADKRPEVRLAVDRDADALAVLDLANELVRLGAGRVMLVVAHTP
ncbi:MAG: hypothetical protein HC788_04805 [Sphingopyxis sp.]|nr:hypothetical protein [Sphingopyxis sp.]